MYGKDVEECFSWILLHVPCFREISMVDFYYGEHFLFYIAHKHLPILNVRSFIYDRCPKLEADQLYISEDLKDSNDSILAQHILSFDERTGQATSLLFDLIEHSLVVRSGDGYGAEILLDVCDL